jgi:hypothetical protein
VFLSLGVWLYILRGARKEVLPGIKLSHDRAYSPNLVEGAFPEVSAGGTDLAMAPLHIPAMRVAEEENATIATGSVTTK